MRHDPASAAIVIMLRALKMYGPNGMMGSGCGRPDGARLACL